MTRPRFDIEIPNARESVFVPPGFATPAQIVECVQAAERMGYHAVWATDFMTASPSSGVPSDESPAWYEPIVTLAYAAAVTTRIKLGTGVVVLPYRDPVILAKQAATLDRLSQGRFLLGLGLGAWRDEFQAIAAWRRRAHRGAMTTEFLEVTRRLLSHDEPRIRFQGEYIAIEDVDLQPRPLQSPLPIYMPGRNAESLDRIARFGDGLMALNTQAAARRDALAEVLAKHARRIESVDVIAEGELYLAASNEQAIAGYKRTRMGRYRERKGNLDPVLANNWIGTVDDVVERIARVREQGIDHFNVLHVAADTVQQRLELMQQFAEEIVPRVS